MIYIEWRMNPESEEWLVHHADNPKEREAAVNFVNERNAAYGWERYRLTEEDE